ncbi:trimethylamine methyltransferase family protein [Mesorhizobium sp. YC-39]|uniref:trimethylamine methyltransferase family protein n=1 Tax=unclassified Mesorhizobium TaxID=325217 RepID=UPI0021E93AFE|nr:MULTISPECIES: trimethylamine methyltransferase family protein [unclassified Mesorhizobium]MCV3211869.1 trimethylamine methyltransferase family protein [Mesorhizobium sp. YC-2]MCV3233592.1 trimethylamine methyltransferase family protein [Mesorhizobium sp. YC-39]
MSARSGGRDARQKLRSDRTVTFLPVLERGLPYMDLLSPDDLLRLHDISMQILEEIGIEFRDDEAIDLWRAAGADVTDQRVRIDRNQLLELVAKAPEYITVHARNPARTVTLGGRKTIFTPAYGSPNVLDLEGKRRNATIEDFVNFAKLAYQAPAMHMTGGVLCEPMDIAVPKRHLHMNYSLIRYSDKPFMGAVTSRERAEDTVAMAKIVFGEEFVQNNTVMVSLANCNSPLVWDATMLDAVKVYSANNQAMIFAPFVLGGASTPASTVAAVAQLNAEALAGVAFAQLVRPGAPCIYGQWLATVSMKSGAPMAGTPEICHMNMLVGQLARHYKLPWRCSGSNTSSKLVDAQAGYEAARNMYGALIAGANFVLSSTGYLEAALTQSYSKFMLDAEQMVMFYKLGQGIVMSEMDETLDAIRQSEPGSHYLGTEHTLKNFEKAFFTPELMNHDSFEQWSFAGAKDANTRGRDAAVQALQDYQAPPIDEAVDEALLDFMKRRELDIGEAVL